MQHFDLGVDVKVVKLVGLFVGAKGVAIRGFRDILAARVFIENLGPVTCQRARRCAGYGNGRQAFVRRNVLEQRQANLRELLRRLGLEALGFQLLVMC